LLEAAAIEERKTARHRDGHGYEGAGGGPRIERAGFFFNAEV